MALLCCSRYRRHVCGSALLQYVQEVCVWLGSAAVGTGGMCVALLCCSRYRRQVCGLAVPALCTGDTGYVCGSAVPAVGTGGMCVAGLCLQ